MGIERGAAGEGGEPKGKHELRENCLVRRDRVGDEAARRCLGCFKVVRRFIRFIFR